MGDLTTLIVPSIVAAIAAPVGAWVSSILLKGKYKAELDSLRVDIQSKVADANNSELDNVRKANDILVDSIVTPLKKEIQTLRKDVDKFRKAVEKIPACPAADHCPVSTELQRSERNEQREQLQEADKTRK